ncbi:response regulator transcription factor [Microbacterium sp. B2969]|uniref:Response regulator transcription factor n=1 Tax=Microbacterium alkaliflavum TaxID=3248839 RepID=A0ABW7QAT3_9MICO
MARTVLIVDDHAEFRSAARAMLELGGFTVVGEAADGDDAVTECARVHPDVVLLDVMLPGEDGFAVARRLVGADDSPMVVLTSTRDAAGFGRRLAATPARGFVAKHELSAAAVTRILDGGAAAP